MSPRAVVAILDRPNARSFGMLGTVVRRDDGLLETSGVLGGPPSILSETELDDLIEGGHARRIREVTSEDSPLVALWVGEAFAADAARFGLKTPPVSGPGATEIPDAKVWVARPKFVWRILDSWLVQAYRRIIKDSEPKIAELMLHVFPERLESRAARWLTIPRRSRSRELEWWLRVDRSNGLTRTARQLTREIEDSIRAAMDAPPPAVVGFAAEARAGDKEIAALVAKDLHVVNVSFGSWLKKQAASQGEQPDRRLLQRLGQNMISTRGELAFCLEVLDSLPHIASQSFVVEGIRHPNVLDSLTALTGVDHFYFTYVSREVNARLALLRMEVQSEAILQQVIHDPTETQIPQLKDRATIEVDGANAEYAANLVIERVAR